MQSSSGKSPLPATWDVPQVFRKRLGTSVGRQRAMAADGQLLLVLHAPPVADEDQRRGRFFWRDAEGGWRSSEQGSGLGSLQSHIGEYAERIDKLDDQVEKAATADQLFQVIADVAPLHRAANNLYQVMQEARKQFPDAREIIDLRDTTYDVSRSAELLYSEANNSLSYKMAKQSEQQSRTAHRMAVSSHRLNLLVAIFFPIATLSAMFGVNLKHTWEETSPPWPFLGLIVIGLVMGAILTAFVLRPPGDQT